MFREILEHYIPIPANLNIPLTEYSDQFKAFLTMVMQDIQAINAKKNQLRDNLTKLEKKALKDLQENENIICPADKSGGIVIMDWSQYHQESLRILGDVQTYLRLNKEPTTQYKKELELLMKEGRRNKILNKKEFLYTNNPTPRLAYFYHIPNNS